MPVNSRPPLTRERILATAVRVADADGIAALTMRRLGAELGVEAMALYHHVPNKAELLAGAADLVAAEVPDPPPGAGWKAELRHRSIATHEALLRHPWCAGVWVGGVRVGPARMRHLDASLAALRRGGFPPTLLELAFHTVQNHVVGHAVQAVSFAEQRATPGEDMATAGLRFLDRPDLVPYPELVAHVRWHIQRPEAPSAFVFGLDLLLDGLEHALVDWTETDNSY